MAKTRMTNRSPRNRLSIRMEPAITPEEAFKIEHLVNRKVAKPPPPPPPAREIGRKALLNPKQMQEFVRRVHEFRKVTETDMTWREAAKLIQEIQGGQSKVSRTSAARYLHQAMSLGEAQKDEAESKVGGA